MKTPIINNNTQISELHVYDTLQVNRELMGPNEIPAAIELPNLLNAPIGSHILHKSSKYTINTVPGVTKISNYKYQYNLTFESDLYRLYDKKLKHLGNRTFQYYGSPSDYAQLIVDNINEIDVGWSVGVCDNMPAITIDFSGHTCRTALDTIAEAFGIEWDEENKTIKFLKQVGNVTTLEFQYGRGKGLYQLSYQYNNDENIVTRAFGYGSSRNLPEGYRDGATQLMFEGLHLDKNIFLPDGVTLLYGIKEGDYENQDIYPEIAGLVSAAPVWIEGDATFTIVDVTLNFNLNDYWSTMDPKLSFKTGELQGQEFTIKKYDNATKTITLEVFQDGNNNTLPRVGFGAAIGDTYTLFDMHLPDEVVQDAEDRLQAATQAWLDENCVPRVLYSLELDPLYARDNGIYLNPGDKVRIIDTALGINEMIRVTKTSYPFIFPEVLTPNTKITCEIANFIPYTTTERVIADTIDNQKEIKVVDRTNAERARLNSLNMKTLAGRIFDPDGNLAKGAETLFAGMLQIGFDSQNFNLIDVTIAPNSGGDENSLVVSAGTLVHQFYEIEGLGYEWAMVANSWSALDPEKFYYVYAKCSKTALSGTWEISETPVSVNDIVGFYAFNLGQLFEVNTDGYRNFEFTKGMTYIVGDQITTGRIQSIDKVNYFDLNTGEFNLQNLLSSLKFNEDGIELGGKIIATSAEFIDLLVKNLRTNADGKRVQILESENNIEIYDTDGNLSIQADDDSAIKTIDNSGPTPVITYGPGISVGDKTDINNSTMVGGRLIITPRVRTGSLDDDEYSAIDKSGIVTTGNMQADGLANFNNISISGGVSVEGNPAVNFEADVRIGGDVFYRMKWIDGILIHASLNP